MMKAPVYSVEGDRVGDVELSPAVFGVEPNVPVMHQAFVRQQSNARAGTHKTQTRSEVARTKSKWYRQKGTGRARHGSRAAPIFVGGGVSHGPRPRSYAKKMPRKMRRLAVVSALSVKAAADAVAIVQALDMDTPRTRVVEGLVGAVGGRATLFVLGARNENAQRSIRNLPGVRWVTTAYVNVRDVLWCDRLLIEEGALAGLEKHLGGLTPKEGVDG
ncbi:MAG: 50S ribosomal protein L4 [Anaerolineae bacterium]